VTSDSSESHEIQVLVHALGTTGRIATVDEATRICRFLGESVLPRRITARVADKHGTHVEDNLEWPRGTTPDEYLESLRAITLDERSGIFFEYSEEDRDWTAYLVGRARRAWRGPSSAGWIVVIFNADRGLWVTGFQPERGIDYVSGRDGFWVRSPR
jgi:hypothetical protein